MKLQLIRAAALALVVGGSWTAPGAQQPAAPIETSGLGEMRWRMIGPHRASRTKATAGIPGAAAHVLYGRRERRRLEDDRLRPHWTPIFDKQPTGSIGAHRRRAIQSEHHLRRQRRRAAAAGSRPPATASTSPLTPAGPGRTSGCATAQQIPQIIVDPKNPDRLFVAVLGHPYGPNEERGIFRSTDGGQTFQKVLYKDENTGGVDVAFDPSNANIVYAVLWEARQGPWENGAFTGPGSGLFKSTDGGTTWKPLTQGTADIGTRAASDASASPSRPAIRRDVRDGRGGVHDGGLYRSDDAGESWYRVNGDPRVVAAATDFAEVQRAPEESRHRLTCRHRGVEIHRRRQDVHARFAARRAATTTTGSGSIPTTPTS